MYYHYVTDQDPDNFDYKSNYTYRAVIQEDAADQFIQELVDNGNPIPEGVWVNTQHTETWDWLRVYKIVKVKYSTKYEDSDKL